jgi:integrase
MRVASFQRHEACCVAAGLGKTVHESGANRIGDYRKNDRHAAGGLQWPQGCAAMPFSVHPHMLRHGCGYALANAGHDTRSLQAYLGHKNIQHTVRYTELAPDRFRDFWR